MLSLAPISAVAISSLLDTGIQPPPGPIAGYWYASDFGLVWYPTDNGVVFDPNDFGVIWTARP